MTSLELKVPPLALVVVFAAAMSGAKFAFPWFTFHVPTTGAIAAVLVAAGIALAVAGVVAFKRQRTTVNPLKPESSASVVSAGVYRFSRNPMYLGFLLALAGLATYLSNAGSMALLPAFVAYMNTFQIEPEERALLVKFGPEFAQYAAKVRRWV